MFTLGPAFFGSMLPQDGEWDRLKSSTVATFSLDGNTFISSKDAGLGADGLEAWSMSATSRATGKYYAEILIGGSYSTRSQTFAVYTWSSEWSGPDMGSAEISSTHAVGTVIGVLLDHTTNTVTFKSNNVTTLYSGPFTAGLNLHIFASASGGAAGEFVTFKAKFKSSEFTYAIPSGYSPFMD